MLDDKQTEKTRGELFFRICQHLNNADTYVEFENGAGLNKIKIALT